MALSRGARGVPGNFKPRIDGMYGRTVDLGLSFCPFARKWVFSSLKITVVQKEPSICGCKIFRKPLTLTEREGLCWFRQGEMSDLAKKRKRRCWE